MQQCTVTLLVIGIRRRIVEHTPAHRKQMRHTRLGPFGLLYGRRPRSRHGIVVDDTQYRHQFRKALLDQGVRGGIEIYILPKMVAQVPRTGQRLGHIIGNGYHREFFLCSGCHRRRRKKAQYDQKFFHGSFSVLSTDAKILIYAQPPHTSSAQTHISFRSCPQSFSSYAVTSEKRAAPPSAKRRTAP